ncbi:uncharacterized protein FIBRA_02443 [Fibroporia radiculosa]|uniref:BTB domain-containing protein n=1 Tax=Fibroporia radiculosa TaxID=599839 RepID=J4G1P5_9APHY|nr:uncharacterized protein FIBRA_02443 [Fibroporia radiculosa]CCM00413.1 predicted protein [Fibroporia radiculosa]
MALNGDFSSNRHGAAGQEDYEILIRHPELSFDDANIAVVAGHQYFLVHKGLLCHHSATIRHSLRSPRVDIGRLLEGRPALILHDSPEELAHFLRALYGFCLNMEDIDFRTASALLRMSTKYNVEHLRKEVLRVLALSWPITLGLWETREQNATSASGVYAPRPALPHPIVIIELAREVNAPELLPSAFYDLSRYLPSQIVTGYVDLIRGTAHQLATEDLLRVLRGKEQAARFFSTFIVNEIEGRTPSEACCRQHAPNPNGQRACQIAFEAINFELIRDVNGMVCNRNSDPLFAISDSFMMQTRDDLPGVENMAVYRACEVCRLEYGTVVEALRQEFWRKIPEWFELEISVWG